MILLIVVFVVFIIDVYAFKGIKMLLSNNHHRLLKRGIYIGFWIVSAIMVLLLLSGYFFRSSMRNLVIFNWYYYFFGIFIVIYVPKILFITFHLLEDIIFGLRWITYKLIRPNPTPEKKGLPISRSKFLSQTGMLLATVPFYSFIWGIAKGRFDFRLEKIRLAFPNLPPSFDGLKIVQISDIHIGGFKGFEEKVKGAIHLANEQQADINFVIYPNPGTGDFAYTIESGVDVVFSLEVFNLTGLMIYEDHNIFVQGIMKGKLDLQFLPNGIYIAHLLDGTNIITRKIVITK